jgi:bacterioferritin-associated ferredoxin
MSQSNNPLKQFFRQPAVYIKLPSSGEYWEQGAVNIPETQELPVYPMTAIDEITYRTPDALFNGQAVVDVIQSCIPDIKNAWAAPVTDINSVLVAIRIASYGHEMEVGTECPACNTQDNFLLDLRSVLDQLHSPDFSSTVKQGDLEIVFKPMTYRHQNQSNVEQFENQRMIRLIPESDLPDDEKLSRMTNIMKSITELTIKALKYSIAGIRTPGAFVTDSAHVEEFLHHCDRAVFTAIRDHAVELRQQTELKPVSLTCSHCENKYNQQLSLDMANFFAPAS